jgi:hypothetical protein
MSTGTAGRALASRLVTPLAWAMAAAALAGPPASLDGPRPAGHVVDTVGLLAEEDVAAIERLAEGISCRGRPSWPRHGGRDRSPALGLSCRSWPGEGSPPAAPGWLGTSSAAAAATAPGHAPLAGST